MFVPKRGDICFPDLLHGIRLITQPIPALIKSFKAGK